MKNTRPTLHDSPTRRSGALSLCLCALTLLGVAHTARGAIYSNSVLNVNINSNMWVTGGAGPSAPAFGNTYVIPATTMLFTTNSATTPNLARAYATNTTSPYTMFFKGDSLSLGSNWLLKLKGPYSGSANYTAYTFTNSSASTSPGLILNGGMIEDGQDAGSGPLTNWLFGVMGAASGTLSYLSLSGSEFYQAGNGKSFYIAATVVGNGNLMVCGGTNTSSWNTANNSVVITNASPASTFSGTWIVEGGYLRPAPNAIAGAYGTNCSFIVDNLYPIPTTNWGSTITAPSARLDLSIPIFSTGTLAVTNSGKLYLNANCVFSAITIAGVPLAANSNYTALALAGMFPNNIVSGGSGILTASASQPGTNIDHYAVTPSASSIGAGQLFTTTVTALDASNNVVNDNSTMVTLSSSTGDAQFDANGDGVYGDNTQTLSAGSFVINTKDNTPRETVTITATDAKGKTGSSSPVTITDYLKLAGVFTNSMVLQRDVPVPVWGWATPGLLVTVTFAGQTQTATADTNGHWRVNLAPMPANASSQTLTATAGDASVVYADVLVGDVWLCSGQSNMVYVFDGNDNEELWNASLVTNVNYPLIRYAAVTELASQSIASDLTLGVPWTACVSNALLPMSAVAFYFGREVYSHTNVPIGLLCSAFGGTLCEGWTSLSALTNVPELISTVDWENSQYAQGSLVLKKTSAVLYNAMIAPLIPYALHGVIWYQGEDNGGTTGSGHQYRVLFPTLIADWRARWGLGDFPFYFEQLVNYSSTTWTDLREAQFLTFRDTPNTGMAVGIDVGQYDSIHPTNKLDIGIRLAQWALTNDYGLNVVPSGPLCRGCAIQGGSIRVSFDYAQTGLMVGLKVGTNAVQEVVGGTLAAFEIAGANTNFVAANASIVGPAVVVSASSVPNPVWVRYGWSADPPCNLYNRAGLPASPFRVTTNSFLKTSITVAGGAATLKFNPPNSTTYWVDCQNSLNGSSWTPLAMPRTSAGYSVVVTNAVSGLPQRFYRVTQWPY